MDRQIQLVKRKLYVFLLVNLTVGKVALQLMFLEMYFVKIVSPLCTNVCLKILRSMLLVNTGLYLPRGAG